jgi:hypothetical protein
MPAITDSIKINSVPSQKASWLRIPPTEQVNIYSLRPGALIDTAKYYIDSSALLRFFYDNAAAADLIHTKDVYVTSPVAEPAFIPSTKERNARTAEMKWLESHAELRRELAGHWVALEGNQLIAHGTRLIEVLKESRAKGIDHPFVACLPEADQWEIAIIA